MDDKSIKRAVETALEFEPSINAVEIGVAVEDGIVTLIGHVASYAEKIAAENTVKRVKSVRGYVDRTEVHLADEVDSDETIARRAANLIEWDVTIPTGAVKVFVSKGFVTLSGEVPWQYQRMAAEKGVRRLAGVRGVSNAIIVKPAIQATDIKRRIEDALEREADIEADKITVTVTGDKVRLDGRVRAWFEREVAEHAAWAAAGVSAVEDKLVVGA